MPRKQPAEPDPAGAGNGPEAPAAPPAAAGGAPDPPPECSDDGQAEDASAAPAAPDARRAPDGTLVDTTTGEILEDPAALASVRLGWNQSDDLPQNPGPRLFAAVAYVMENVEAVPKDARNKEQGWAYSSEAAISNTVRGLMGQAGLVLLPIREKVHATMGTPKSGSGQNYTPATPAVADVTITYMLAHTSGEFLHLDASAQGQDYADKALPKAKTYALKNLLVHLFLLGRGDTDGDATTTPPGGSLEDQRAAARQAQAEAEAARAKAERARQADAKAKAEAEAAKPRPAPLQTPPQTPLQTPPTGAPDPLAGTAPPVTGAPGPAPCPPLPTPAIPQPPKVALTKRPGDTGPGMKIVENWKDTIKATPAGGQFLDYVPQGDRAGTPLANLTDDELATMAAKTAEVMQKNASPKYALLAAGIEKTRRERETARAEAEAGGAPSDDIPF